MSYTNSSMATFRRCPREYEWRYLERIEPDVPEREPLSVGTAWHAAHESRTRGEDPYEAIARHAPGELWRVKLSRLFAAYEWYWQDQPVNVVEVEIPFEVDLEGRKFAGVIDGIAETPDGRLGIIERKTTSFDLSPESRYWSKLRLDTQVGVYSIAFNAITGKSVDFILYDVVRKPTIKPARIAKKLAEPIIEDAECMRNFVYCGEQFEPRPMDVDAVREGRENEALYGARLTQDIGKRPEFYFARREVPRTAQDFNALRDDLMAQTAAIGHAVADGLLFRNPDSCNVFGVCDFFGLCSNNCTPSGKVPDGFRQREHQHAELPH